MEKNCGLRRRLESRVSETMLSNSLLTVDYVNKIVEYRLEGYIEVKLKKSVKVGLTCDELYLGNRQ